MRKEVAMKNYVACLQTWKTIGNTYFKTNFAVFQLKHKDKNKNKIQLT